MVLKYGLKIWPLNIGIIRVSDPRPPTAAGGDAFEAEANGLKRLKGSGNGPQGDFK
jgi:hypothetical protein